jgi:heme exporter protein C
MALTFLVSLVAMTVLFVTLWKYELASKHASIKLRSLRRRLAGDE